MSRQGSFDRARITWPRPSLHEPVTPVKSGSIISSQLFHASERFGMGTLAQTLPCFIWKVNSKVLHRVFSTKLCWKWVSLLSSIEGDVEYAIISAASMSDSVDDTTQYLNDSWWRDCLTMCMMFGTRYTWPSPVPCVIHVLMFRGDRDEDVANCEFLWSCRVDDLSANQFLAYVWWSMFKKTSQSLWFMI